MEEEGVITECLIKVLDDTDTIDFDFQTENVVAKVVFKVGTLLNDEFCLNRPIFPQANGFKEALSEIDLKADCIYSFFLIFFLNWFALFCSGIELLITQDVPHFRLIANGCGGSTSVDITQDSPVMDTFLCTQSVHNR